MRLTVFDIGGSSVKHALWDGEHLVRKSAFPTPKTWEAMKAEMEKVKEIHDQGGVVEGIAMSCPGAVNRETGIIGGLSAVSYIHGFPIREELEGLFHLPVSMENDANCAALAELHEGVAKDVDHALFLIIGSGIGGTVIQGRKIHRGKNLFGGEFGYMLLDESHTLSALGSPVKAAERYRIEMGLDVADGTLLFREADRGEPTAMKHVESLVDALARGIYNLSVAFNPDLVILGGGISDREDLIERISGKVVQHLKDRGAEALDVSIVPCTFRNDANLLGAVLNFLEPDQK
ncbi:ROK family protein [Proteiniclasticum sp. C24MP]|uniref:ROK family protein n=1 Tax=Proteiniclasticum sp. C24MP TaxID=3374101 RepID=UPI0037551192